MEGWSQFWCASLVGFRPPKSRFWWMVPLNILVVQGSLFLELRTNLVMTRGFSGQTEAETLRTLLILSLLLDFALVTLGRPPDSDRGGSEREDGLVAPRGSCAFQVPEAPPIQPLHLLGQQLRSFLDIASGRPILEATAGGIPTTDKHQHREHQHRGLARPMSFFSHSKKTISLPPMSFASKSKLRNR